MSIELSFIKRNLVRNVSSLVDILSESLVGQFENEDSVITREAQIILDNPIDKSQVDQAVQELKSDKSIKSKRIILSNKEEVILSVH